jgi:STE24 endopeptidase
MGNAAVMGLIPQVRYILLSDLLLESMTDQEVEAVFAHELGHIVHRHLAWYVVMVIILMLGMSIGEIFLNDRLTHLHLNVDPDVTTNVVGVGIFFLVFGFLSRRFERQADVYAARTIEKHAEGKSGPEIDRFAKPQSGGGSSITEASGALSSGAGHVGQYGAAVFSKALYRVAVVNNIPIAARNFSHGSIATRMKYLNDLAHNPRRTDEFDRFMILVYSGLLLALALFGACAWVYRQKLMS